MICSVRQHIDGRWRRNYIVCSGRAHKACDRAKLSVLTWCHQTVCSSQWWRRRVIPTTQATVDVRPVRLSI